MIPGPDADSAVSSALLLDSAAVLESQLTHHALLGRCMITSLDAMPCIPDDTLVHGSHVQAFIYLPACAPCTYMLA